MIRHYIIERNYWKNYFDFISKDMRAQQVELEVVGLDLGDQIEEEWVSFEGISYDTKKNILFVHTATIKHTILEPLEIVVEDEDSMLRSIAVKDRLSHLQLIKLRSPLQIGE